jgi:hypothetical protein
MQGFTPHFPVKALAIEIKFKQLTNYKGTSEWQSEK